MKRFKAEVSNFISRKIIEDLVREVVRRPPRDPRSEAVRRDHGYLVQKLLKAMDKSAVRSARELDKLRMSVVTLGERLTEVHQKLAEFKKKREDNKEGHLRHLEERRLFAEQFPGAKKLTESGADSPLKEEPMPRFQTKMAPRAYRPGVSSDEDLEELSESSPSKPKLSTEFSLPIAKRDDSDFMGGEESPEASPGRPTRGQYDFRNIPYFEAKEDEEASSLVPERDGDPPRPPSQRHAEPKTLHNDNTLDQSLTLNVREKAMGNVLHMVRQFLELRGRPSVGLTEESVARVLAGILNEFEELEMRLEELPKGKPTSHIDLEILEPSSKDSKRESNYNTHKSTSQRRLWQNLPIGSLDHEEFGTAEREEEERSEGRLRTLVTVLRSEMAQEGASAEQRLRRMREVLEKEPDSYPNQRPETLGQSVQLRPATAALRPQPSVGTQRHRHFQFQKRRRAEVAGGLPPQRPATQQDRPPEAEHAVGV